jgi:RimJ/RimL family protein N-acetyltransferase
MNENVIEFRSERLKMVCIGLDMMLLLKEGNTEKQFESSMGYSINKVEGLEKELIDQFSCLALENQESRVWFRLWDIVLLKSNKRIGGALFKGGPNGNDEVEIGYGIDDEFQGQGYATEAIQCIVQWAVKQEGVISVIAETEKENIASGKVLQHIGMSRYSETETDYWWRYKNTINQE